MTQEASSKFLIKNLFNVENRVAVVTGGGTGIGLMIAQALAFNGAKVYITGRRLEVLQQAVKAWSASIDHPSGKLIPVQSDITSKESILKLRDEISSLESHLDILVNNAGISQGSRNVETGDESPEKLSEELFSQEWSDWSEIMDINVTGYYYTSTAFLPLLAKSTNAKSGWSASVINITSISGLLNSSQHHIDYNTSKAAAIQLTTLLAQEFSRPGTKVRVNSIAPGIFPSEMTAKDSHDETKKSHIPAEGFREDKNIAAGRPGRDEDMAQAAIALAVNQYINGQTQVVDGGYLLGNP